MSSLMKSTKMTAAQLNAWIAKKRGFKKRNGWWECGKPGSGYYHGSADVPDFCHDWSLALELVAEMRKERLVIIEEGDFEDGTKTRKCSLSGDIEVPGDETTVCICQCYYYARTGYGEFVEVEG